MYHRITWEKSISYMLEGITKFPKGKACIDDPELWTFIPFRGMRNKLPII